MRVADLSAAELRDRLRGPGLDLPIGPFSARIQSDLDEVAGALALLYSEFALERRDFADFHVGLERVRRLRTGLVPEVTFLHDGVAPFLPMPRRQASAFLEWGLNWCIASQVHDLLTMHAAAVERNGRAFVLPGAPGSGKSTLCAGLVARGWRLLSDEFALFRLDSGELLPTPRPISLKNDSIAIIRERIAGAAMTRPSRDARKGMVAHLRPPPDSVARMREPAKAAWIVFPTFESGARTRLAARGRGSAFMALAENSFNYSTLGKRGFQALTGVVAGALCADLEFSDLDSAISALERLAGDDGFSATMEES